MKARLGDVRRTIREELLHGVPEWQIREDASRFVETLRDRITGYIRANKSTTTEQSTEAIESMNAVCDELEDKVYDLVQNQLFAFVRNV